MAELLLHIGLPKTGTTLLQKSLQSNVASLNRAGWQYPSFIGSANHVCVPLSFVEGKRAQIPEYPELATPRGRSDMRALLARELDRNVKSGSRWVMSAEGFTARFVSPQDVERMRGFFTEWFSDINAVVYLRRQEPMLVSLYSQHLREHASLIPKPLDERFVEMGGHLLDHQGTYNRWCAGLGEENVIVRPYLEKYKKGNGELILDFSGVLGLPRPLHTPAGRRENESLSARGAALIRQTARDRRHLTNGSKAGTARLELLREAINPFVVNVSDDGSLTMDRQAFNRAVGELTPGPPQVMSPELLEFVRAEYQSANEALVDQLGRSDLWQEWLGQDGQTAGLPGPVELTDVEIDDILQELRRKTVPATRNRSFKGRVRSAQSKVGRSIRRVAK